MKLRNVAVLACAAALMAVGSAHADEIGKPAKPYKIYLLDKSMITSDQLKGKVVVVNRWATWCTPARPRWWSSRTTCARIRTRT
ncbi:MAG: TlpA family protein disulfide reductase [Phenylobacterium sp.]